MLLQLILTLSMTVNNQSNIICTDINPSPFIIPTSSTIPMLNYKKCNNQYTDRIINKMGIKYIPIHRLVNIIRFYNYNTYKIPKFAYKKDRKSFRKHFYNNYKLYSFSDEINYLDDVCNISYDKINIKQLKYKYKIAILISRNRQHRNALTVLLILIVLTGVCILLISSCLMSLSHS